jgi:deazaflavin-dependent oxidoreductase (nitroreductase family)
MLFGDQHVQTYRESSGEQGYDWNGTTILLLGTVGRKSGEPRTHPLIYRDYPGRDGSYLIVASKGGADTPPAWYLNLLDQPEVTVQIKGDVFTARARVATAEEKPALWEYMTQVWPDYDEYQKKTDRPIPIVVLERV